ncbi:MAG: glycosyltransferase family 4 protein [Clostridium chrysemydis]|uniref:glycosyltransferase family 4 protein n=1 Tax=Clostridium chrysemydis TaxID=2665504 RepID=UPI003F3500AA
MKKVLYITTVSRTINAFLIPHIKMLVSNGYKVDCACCIDKEINNELTDLGVEIFDLPFSRNPFSYGNLKAFKKLINIQKEKKYDIVHVHTPVASIYGRMLKLKFKGIKTIYTAHGYHFLKGGSKIGWIIYYPIEKVMAKLTDVTININIDDYEITKKRLKPKQCYLVPGVGINLEEYKPLSETEKVKKRKELKINDDDFVIIMIAELNKNKNQIQLVNAMELLKDKYPNIKAILVGEGQNRNILEKEVEIKGLQNNIIFLGFRNDVNELINIADIGVLLSYREGLPRNLMELMANNKKVIATKIRGCKDIITNNNIGRLVDINDYIDTANKIEELYLDKENSNNFVKYLEKYEEKNICKKLKDIMR